MGQLNSLWRSGAIACQISGENRIQASPIRPVFFLLNKIENLQRGKESAEQQRVEKIRRQKRKRSKRAKEKMLADKKIISAKKQLRGAVKTNGT